MRSWWACRGSGKSRLVETLGVVAGLSVKRVQFTPDLMPADIIGSEVLEEIEARRGFRFIPGPVFCQLLMADEINRASPRTQSALLQAMQERRVTAGGHEHRLPTPFHVLATQNPIEQEGTYPLPEAQLDRFLLQIDIGYPDIAAERDHAARDHRRRRGAFRHPAMTEAELREAQALIRRVPVGETVLEAILVAGTRRPAGDRGRTRRCAGHVAWGPGPRAAQALMLACRARALLDGRLAPSIDDVAALARPALRHRMALSFAGAGRRRGVERGDRPPGGAAWLDLTRSRPDPTRRAEALAARLPPLLVAAERVAATVAQGVHGRRRSGRGDSFWQFRHFVSGDALARIDWRRSARSGRPDRTAGSCARRSGRRHRPCACGATARPAWTGARPAP